LKIVVGAGKSLNFNTNFLNYSSRTPKEKEQTQKYLRDKITHVVEKLKRHRLKVLFALNGQWSP